MRKVTGKGRKAAKDGGGMAGPGGLLTAGKLAEAWGVKPAEVKKAIAAAGVRPDAVRCGCAYYGAGTAAAIRKHLVGG